MIDGGVGGPGILHFLEWATDGQRLAQKIFGMLAPLLDFRDWRPSIGGWEMRRSLSKRAFVHALQHLIPSITFDLIPGRAGVRAQAVTPEVPSTMIF